MIQIGPLRPSSGPEEDLRGPIPISFPVAAWDLEPTVLSTLPVTVWRRQNSGLLLGVGTFVEIGGRKADYILRAPVCH